MSSCPGEGLKLHPFNRGFVTTFPAPLLMPEYVWQEPSECDRVYHVVVATIKRKITLNHMSFKSDGDCTLQILALQIEKAVSMDTIFISKNEVIS